MKISWIVLTYNRHEVVKKAVLHNMLNAGRSIEEIIWVDNGSQNPQFPVMPQVTVLHQNNLGVAKGYNRGMLLASGDYIVITGCDRLMPNHWLATYQEYLEKIPHTGIISTYSQPIEVVPERHRNEKREIELVGGLPIMPAMPIEARILSRELQRKIGFLHEGLGLYGWEDVIWGERAEKITSELGLMNYIIPGHVAEHLGTEGIHEWNGKDEKEYHEFKKKESADPQKQVIIDQYRSSGHPYYNPYLLN